MQQDARMATVNKSAALQKFESFKGPDLRVSRFRSPKSTVRYFKKLYDFNGQGTIIPKFEHKVVSQGDPVPYGR
jgi:hypothetical protein